MSRLKGKTKSKKKWESIVEEIRAQEVQDYLLNYWSACDYCYWYRVTEDFYECEACPLSKVSKIEDYPYCRNVGGQNLAYLALDYANQKNWVKALKYAKSVLSCINRDIKREISR